MGWERGKRGGEGAVGVGGRGVGGDKSWEGVVWGG